MKRVALVTGGSRGIGLGIVKAMREAGMLVAVVSRHNTNAGDMNICADLTHLHERYGLIQKVVDGLGGLDILVNNAGEQYSRDVVEYERTEWDRQLELMLTAPFDLSQQAAKYMRAHSGGHIVNILSTAAFQGARNITGYIAAKHGLLGVTRAMSIELAPEIHVNAVAPGLIETDMTKHMNGARRELLESITPAGRFGKVEEVADAVMFLVNSTFLYGHVVMVDGGWMVKNG